MIIGIDGNEANVSQRVGVSWTTFYLLKEMQLKANAQLRFRIFLKQLPLADLPSETAYFHYVVVHKKTVWSQIDLPLALWLKHRDLNIFLSPAHYCPRFCPCQRAVIIHDLSYFYYPEDFLTKDLYQLINWTRYSVNQAQKVIAVSQKTKEDLIKNYQVAEQKIAVIENGFSQPIISVTKPNFNLQSPYFLYLVTAQQRKNLKNLILAFEKFLEQSPNYTLYLVGKMGWLYQKIERLIKQRKLSQKIIFTGYLPEAEKWYLLKHSQALIMPGLYEGFGLPILEAFSAQVPVLCSQTGALPEVAGQAALYFDPVIPEELTQQMALITTDSKQRISLIKLGEQQLKRFSWSKTADRLLKLLAD